MKKAFTIIETLVAITILMIAISGPLTAAFRAMTASVAARDQMTASFLAQDAIEYVRNVKDNNIANGNTNGPLDGLTICTINNKCTVDSLTKEIDTDCNNHGNHNCQLYRSSNGEYHYHGGTATKFYRTFYIKNISAESARAVVEVVWQTGAYNTATTTLQNDLYYVVK